MSSEPLSPSKEPRYLFSIGETGTGKTTMINSFANYSRYATLDEAIEKGPVVLADVGFNYSAAGRKAKKVTVFGSVSSREQVTVSGITSTEGCSVYTIGSADSTSEDLIFYDSPGFGSQSFTEVDMDKRAVHALCVVLKPDETRLHVDLRSFLEKEGKSFAKNIIYCFTNTRAHNFLPAATLNTLRDFLLDLEETLGVELPTTKENVFCFENDCFRYLCYLSTNSSEGKSRHHNVFSREWDKNVKEFSRLVNYVKTLNPILHNQLDEPDLSNQSGSDDESADSAPSDGDRDSESESSKDFEQQAHPLEDVSLQLEEDDDSDIDWLAEKTENVSLQKTKEAPQVKGASLSPFTNMDTVSDLLSELANPLIKTMQNSVSNTVEIAQLMEDINRTTMSAEGLKKVLSKKRTVIKSLPLSQPRTICTFIRCSSIHKLADGSSRYEPKNGPCHDPCFDHDRNRNGKICIKIFNSGFCEVCGCHLDYHQNVQYLLYEDTEEVFDPIVQQELLVCNNETQQKQVVLDSLNEKLAHIDEEVSNIRKICVEFSAFLNYSSVKNGADPFSTYLDNLIQTEMSVRNTIYFKLYDILSQHKIDVQRTIRAVKYGQQPKLNQLQVQSKIDSLCRLHYSGPLITEIVAKF